MKHTKNYVGKHGKRLSDRASKLGISNDLIIKCIDGDETALREVGDKGNEGTRILTIMPYIRDNAMAFLKGTGEYNKTLADVYKTAGETGIAIDRATASTAVANLKYGHERSEIALELSSNRRLENQRFRESLDLVKLRAYIDYHMSQVDHLYSEQAQYARPNNAQIAADLSYRDEKDKHLLTHGNNANLDDLPQKQYLTDGLVRKFRSVMSTFFE
jgi:hypothetical protein